MKRSLFILIFSLPFLMSGQQDKFPITALDHSCLIIPNAYSPNGDSNIDYFNVYSSCPVFSFDIQIYDRWGDKVFSSHDINEHWYGTKGDKLLPGDVYYYDIHFQSAPKSPEEHKTGTVTLIR